MRSRKSFKVKRMNDEHFRFVVFTLSEERIHEFFGDIEKKLRDEQYSGDVLFDLLLNNGRKDRFYKSFFNGERLILSSFSFADSISCNLRISLNSFYSKNFKLIENSNLSSASKFLMKKELSQSLQA